jgi:uncharacterized damage-inducible protein DinB
MFSVANHFLTMAYNNAWANHRLLKACTQLSQDDFIAARTSFFPSIKATLNHILTVDWYYVDALERSINEDEQNREAWKFFDPEEPYSTCSELHPEQRRVDGRLIKICEMLTDESIDRIVSIPRYDGAKYEKMFRLLSHLFQHQIHHRGQVHAMLAGTSVKPPPLDEFFLACEAASREDDLSELGFSEQNIWFNSNSAG